MENTQNEIWDPIQEQITQLNHNDLDLKEKIWQYKKVPQLFKIYMGLCLAIGLGVTLLFIFYLSNNQDFDIRILLVSYAPAVMYYLYVKNLQEESILSLLCEKNNWIFDSHVDYGRLTRFKALIPDIFSVGSDQKFEEQIWGTISYKNTSVPFWSAKFSYIIGSGRSRHTESKPIFILKLLQRIPVDITLTRENFFTRFEHNLQTESHEFNTTFRIIADTSTPENKQAVISLLSPAVQTRLVDFAKKYPLQKITFQDELMILVLQESLWKTRYTNFFIKPEINQKDVEIFDIALLDMVELPSEMIQFID